MKVIQKDLHLILHLQDMALVKLQIIRRRSTMIRDVYNMDFKKQVLREAKENSNTVAVARKYEINVKLIYKWKRLLSTSTSKETTPLQNKGKRDLQVILIQLEEIQSKLDLLKSNDFHNQFMAEINASTAKMESIISYTLNEIQGQFSEMMKTHSQMNNNIGNTCTKPHNKINSTNNFLPSQQRPTNDLQRSILDDNLDRALGLI